MKHNTHIYLASKAIEFLHDSVDNLRYLSGSAAASKTKTTKYNPPLGRATGQRIAA